MPLWPPTLTSGYYGEKCGDGFEAAWVGRLQEWRNKSYSVKIMSTGKESSGDRGRATQRRHTKETQKSPCGGSICEKPDHMAPQPGLGFQLVLWTQPVHRELRDHSWEDAQGSALHRPGSSMTSAEERWTLPRGDWVLNWEGAWDAFLGLGDWKLPGVATAILLFQMPVTIY